MLSATTQPVSKSGAPRFPADVPRRRTLVQVDEPQPAARLRRSSRLLSTHDMTIRPKIRASLALERCVSVSSAPVKVSGGTRLICGLWSLPCRCIRPGADRPRGWWSPPHQGRRRTRLPGRRRRLPPPLVRSGSGAPGAGHRRRRARRRARTHRPVRRGGQRPIIRRAWEIWACSFCPRTGSALPPTSTSMSPGDESPAPPAHPSPPHGGGGCAGGQAGMTVPPSTQRIWPLTRAASSEAKKRAAPVS